MNKLFTLFLALMASVTISYATVYSDTHDTFSWTLDTETGVLEFSGAGEIVSYVGWWGNYKNDIRTIVINQGITSLSTRIFQEYELLQTVSLPDGLERIGSYAFSGCRALSSCNLPSTVRKIGSSAFYACALTSVVIPEGVDTLLSTFYQDTTLRYVSLPSTIKYIDQNAFYNNRIETVVLAEGIKTIPADLFSRDRLKTINIPSSFTSIPRSCFYRCTALTNVTIAAGLDSINAYAFSGCTSLKSIVLPAGLKYIGKEAFYGAGLTDISIPSTVTKIDTSAFCGAALLSATIGDAAVDIQESAFYSCKKLKTLTIGSGVKSIEDQAFERCDALETVTFTGPSSANCIWGDEVFFRCDSLKSITIPEGVVSLGDQVLGYCKALEYISVPSTITSYGENILVECNSLATIHLAEGLKSFPREIFSGMWGSLTTMNIPASFGSIPNGYFGYAFDKLENVTIAEGLDSIGTGVFWGCNALKNIVLPEGLKYIGAQAFSSSALTSVTIPSSLISMGQSAFEECASLVQVTIPDGAQFDIPSKAFYKCKSLSQLSIGTGVRAIGNEAFGGTKALKSVVLPSTIQSLGSSAFSSGGLTELFTIPSSVKRLEGTFSYCNSLKVANISAGVDSLVNTFAYCGKIQRVDIPATVKYMDNYTFTSDTIWKMYVHWLNPSEVEVTQIYANRLDTLYVPYGTKSLYQNRTPWNNFQYIFEMPLLKYDLWINGKQLTERNYQHIVDSVPDVLADDISFDPATNTLSLHNAFIAPTGAYAIQSSIPNLTIEVRGNDSIDGANNWSGIRLNKSATITGDGKLSVNAKGEGIGIFLYNDNSVTLTENIELTITGGAEISAKGMSGISGYGGSVAIGKPYGAVLTVNNARVTAAFHGNTNVLNTGRRGGGLEYLHALNLNGVAIVSPSNAIFRPKQMSSVVDASTDAVIPEVVIGPTKNCYDVETEFSAVSDDAYEWNDSVYTVSGNYQQTFKTVEGCDSVVTLRLTVFPHGKCGDNLYWVFRSTTGELIITGTGAMYDYDINIDAQAPWQTYSSDIKSVSLSDGIAYIGRCAFKGLQYIAQSVEIPESVTSLGAKAFSGCSAMPAINIPSQVTAIPDELFLGCYNLYNLSIPTGVKTIGKNAFANCWHAFARDPLFLPEGLQTIGNYAFDGANLLSVTIPANVTSIGKNAFSDCGSDYYNRGIAFYVDWDSPLAIPSNVFENTNLSIDTLYVPCRGGNAYQTAEGWKDFGSIIKPSYSSEFTKKVPFKYVWNNVEYTVSGDYEQTLLTSEGCDSVVTMHLDVDAWWRGDDPDIKDLGYIEQDTTIRGLTIVATKDHRSFVNYSVALYDTLSFTHYICTNFGKNPDYGYIKFDVPGNVDISIYRDKSRALEIAAGTWNNTIKRFDVNSSGSTDVDCVEFLYVGEETTIFVGGPTLGTYIYAIHVTPIDISTAVDHVRDDSNDMQSSKILRNGVLYIRHGEKIYTAQGMELK